eukprot:2332960-Lingulodinium_polyedra.AAC.1
MVGRRPGDRRAMVGRWAGRWPGDGRSVVGRWSIGGEAMARRWSGVLFRQKSAPTCSFGL